MTHLEKFKHQSQLETKWVVNTATINSPFYTKPLGTFAPKDLHSTSFFLFFFVLLLLLFKSLVVSCTHDTLTSFYSPYPAARSEVEQQWPLILSLYLFRITAQH